MNGNVDASIYIIVAIVSFVIAAFSFIVMIVNDIRHHKQDTYRFDGLDKGNDQLSSEHDKLGRDLSEKIHDIGMRQEVLKDKFFEYIGREDGRKEKITAILPKQDVLSQIQILYDKILALSDENTKLKYQNQQLQKELSHMRNEILDRDQKGDEWEQIVSNEDIAMDDSNSFDEWER